MERTEIVAAFEGADACVHGGGPSTAEPTRDQRLSPGVELEQFRHWLDATQGPTVSPAVRLT